MADYLLNIGPQGDGSLTPETVKAFQAVGRWMRVNSEAIYGTSASPFAELAWGRLYAEASHALPARL